VTCTPSSISKLYAIHAAGTALKPGKKHPLAKRNRPAVGTGRQGI
jgi:hypothetical protein